MRAEMLTELRMYNPARPTEASTQVKKMVLLMVMILLELADDGDGDGDGKPRNATNTF